MQHCSGKTNAGAPCRAPAGSGGLCFFHANPDKAHALGQIGGRKNRSQLREPLATGSLSAGDLSAILAKAIDDVLAKKITPRTASALSQLCNSSHRILQSVDLEGRLARLDQQLAAQENRTLLDTTKAKSCEEGETGGGRETESGAVDTPGSADGEQSGNDGPGERGE